MEGRAPHSYRRYEREGGDPRPGAHSTGSPAPRRDHHPRRDVPRTYQRADDKQEVRTAPEKVRAVLVQRLEDYTAIVHRTTPLPARPRPSPPALGGGSHRRCPLRAPVPVDRRSGGGADRRRRQRRPRMRLDAIDAVLTGCHTAIALTGTIVLRSDARGGRRAISLVPDHHVVVVEADQIVPRCPQGHRADGRGPPRGLDDDLGPQRDQRYRAGARRGASTGRAGLEVVLIEPEPETDTEPFEQEKTS